MYRVRISSNQGADFESGIVATFPQEFDCSEYKSPEPLRSELEVITEFLWDNISLLLVFSATLGFKKFLEAFASEAGKALAAKLFGPVTDESRRKKLAEFKTEHGLSEKQEVAYLPHYNLDVAIEETRESYAIAISNKESFESSESLRQEVLRLLHDEVERAEHEKRYHGEHSD